MNRAFEIRLYPTKLQEQKINQTFGACRFVYNSTLYLKQKYYKEKIQMNIHEKLVNENPWLKEVEAKEIDRKIKAFLTDNNLEFKEINGTEEGYNAIVKDIIERLGK